MNITKIINGENMKKAFIFLISLIICAALLAGCAAPQASISNTYKFGYYTEEETGLFEHLEYSVKADEQVFEGSYGIPVFSYIGTGNYTSDLYFVSGNEYRLQTSFTFTGKIKYNQQNTYSETFTDTITSVSYFNIAIDYFTAKSVTKNYSASVPFFENEAYTLKKAEYTVSAAYEKTEKGFKMVSSVTDTGAEGNYKVSNKENASYTSEITGRFFDNDQAFTGLRVQSLGTTFKDSFYMFDPLNAKTQKFNVTTAEKTDNKVYSDPDTEEDKTCACVVLTAAGEGDFAGNGIVMYYSQDLPVRYMIKDGETVKVMDNTTNVSLLLEIKHGDFLYTLTDYDNYAAKPAV